MASKYDTNPLDPDFPKKAAHAAQEAGPQRVQPISSDGAETRPFANEATEEPTRRYDAANFAQYSSVYQEPVAGGNMYHAPKTVIEDVPSSRKVEAVGLPENILMVLPYAPFFIGLVASILELIFVPQSEGKIRFHAAQGLAAHAAILIITMVLKLAGEITGYGGSGNAIFGSVATVLLIVAMIKIWRGKPVHIPQIEALTEWISDKIKPHQNK